MLSDSAVHITVGDSSGSGFLISGDGLIVTAGHVVIANGVFASSINVTLSGYPIPQPVDPAPVPNDMQRQMLTRDFALLKLRTLPVRKLHFLQLGSDHETPLGGDITIVGFPYGATVPYCITGTVAAHIEPQIDGVVVPMIAYQGIAVHGLSGSPIFDNSAGTVIGVVTLNMVGISKGLKAVRSRIQDNESGRNDFHTQTTMNGVSFGPTMLDLINVIDVGLANGLGYGIGSDPIVLTIQQARLGKEK
jgi:V8-like Glu-specific endopeptidase